MKRILLSILAISFFALIAFAKKPKADHPHAEIKVSYNWHGTNVRDDGVPIHYDYEYLLLASPTNSKFYNSRNEWQDSLMSTPKGEREFNRIFDDGVRRHIETGDESGIITYKGFLWVFKSNDKGETTVYDVCGLGEGGYYTEPHSEIVWNLCDSTKTVMGYACSMAETDYHGRHWTVWFTPEIPIQDGPWKLCGLPGLILEASEAEGLYSFTASGMERSDKEMYPIWLPKKYKKMSRKELLKAYRDYRNNAFMMTKMILNDSPDGVHYGDNIKVPEKKIDYEYDFMETDYR